MRRTKTIVTVGLALGFTSAVACVDPYESRLNQKCFADEHCDEGQFCEKAEDADEGFCRKAGETMDPSESDPTNADASDTMDPSDGSEGTTGDETTGPTDPTNVTVSTGSTTETTDPTDPTDASTSTTEGTEGTDSGDGSTGGQGCQPTVATYGPVDTYDVGANPQGIAVGDIDGDEIIDVAISSRDEQTIGIFLNDGNGNFTPNATHAVTGSPSHVALGPIADIVTDVVVVADVPNQFIRARGDGAGGFVGNAYYDGVTGGFAMADLDGDDVLDLVTPGLGTVQTYLGSAANETFGAPISSTHANGAVTITTGDLDGDGILDVITGHYTGQAVGVGLGLGNGSFNDQPTVAGGGLVQGVATGHFDDDANLDVAFITTGQNSDAVRVLHGNGDGTFEAMVEVLAVPTAPYAIASGDLDADGDDDVVGASQSGQIALYLNEADGLTEGDIETCGGNLGALALAHLDDDCVLDVVAADRVGDQLCVFLSQ